MKILNSKVITRNCWRFDVNLHTITFTWYCHFLGSWFFWWSLYFLIICLLILWLKIQRTFDLKRFQINFGDFRWKRFCRPPGLQDTCWATISPVHIKLSILPISLFQGAWMVILAGWSSLRYNLIFRGLNLSCFLVAGDFRHNPWLGPVERGAEEAGQTPAQNSAGTKRLHLRVCMFLRANNRSRVFTLLPLIMTKSPL